MDNVFQPLNNYFDKTLVLTLPRLTNRIEFFEKKFSGLKFDFFYGIDKQDTSLEKLKSEGLYSSDGYRKFYKKPSEISLGMLCCALGHMKIYRHIVENNIATTLILEDDAVPNFETLKHFSTIINELPTNWELFYLGYEKHEHLGWKEKMNQKFLTLFPTHPQLKLPSVVFKNYYARRISSHISKAGFHDCTHAYAITLDAAKKLLNHHRICFHPDNLLQYLNCTGAIRGYVSNTKLINQLSAFTNQIDSLTED